MRRLENSTMIHDDDDGSGGDGGADLQAVKLRVEQLKTLHVNHFVEITLHILELK